MLEYFVFFVIGALFGIFLIFTIAWLSTVDIESEEDGQINSLDAIEKAGDDNE